MIPRVFYLNRNMCTDMQPLLLLCLTVAHNWRVQDRSEKADKSEKETPLKWDRSRITSENSASNWTFVPIGSPHYNGLPEATVKVLKRTLNLSLHPGVELSYPELVTLLAKISYTVNSRPLGLANVSQSSQQEDNMLPLLCYC